MGSAWTVLGAGSILPRRGYGCAGHALRPAPLARVTLFDCGPGTLRALAEAGLSIGEVERIVISHFHPDHWLDLLALAFARRNPALRAPPDPAMPDLEIIGPRGLADLLERAASIFPGRTWLRFDGVALLEVEPSICARPLERGSGPGREGDHEREAMRLSWTATRHTPESLAWRVDLAGGASVAYTGDSGESRAVADLARGVDLFVCECSFPDERAVEHHLTPTSAGRLAHAAGCRRLLLTHFYPSLAPEVARAGAAAQFGGPIEVSRDGSVHAIGPARAGAGSTLLI